MGSIAAVSDTTAIFIALGPAVITGVVAWLTSRNQRDTSLALSQDQRDAHLSETREATERIRLEHREAERRERLGRYHEFLLALRRFDAMMAGHAELSEDGWRAWLQDYYDRTQWIELVGEDEVVEAISPLQGLLQHVGETAIEDDSGGPFHERLSTAYRERRDEILTRRRHVAEAVRHASAA